MAESRAQEALVVVGIDCAAQPRDVGLAAGVLTDGRPRIARVATRPTWAAIVDQVADWRAGRTLIALDAPLGWPKPLGDVLPIHRAGASLPAPANMMFRRTTDDVVADRVGKRPLDVGADRIARTAHAALSFLGRLRERTGLQIPMAWTPGTVEGTAAIEVYPAGTLAGRGLPHSGYKGSRPEAIAVRQRLVEALSNEVLLDAEARAAMDASDHILDAALCVMAGFDFATGDVITPTDRLVAEREGWIWVKPPQADV